MAIFGLVSKREYNLLLQEIQALKAAPAWERWQLETAGAEKFNLPDPAVYDNQAQLYRKLAWVLTAVDMTAQSAALTPFGVKRIIQGREPKDIPNHPFELLMNNPNPLDSRFEFLYATIAYWKLNGNGYWWLNRKSDLDAPEEMWVIPPSMIIPVPDEQMYLRGYMYYPGNGREIFFYPHEIMHFRRFNPFSRFLGLSAIEAIATVAMGDLQMADWNTRLFAENNARLPGVMTFQDMIEDSTWEKIKNDTREASRKRELLMLRGVGQGGVNWMQNAVSQKDMEFLAGRKANKEEIWSVLAPGLMSMLSENATEANSRTGRAVFNELTVYPMHVLMAEKITNQLLPVYAGRPLIGEFEDIRITDRQLELQEQQQFALTHTVEEIREQYYGHDPVGDERDKLFPAQIKPESGGIQKPPPAPIAAGGPGGDQAAGDGNEPGVDITEQQGLEEQPMPEEDETAKAYREELGRMRRKAMKNIGRAIPFETDIIPADVVSMIRVKLAACKSAEDIKRVFAGVQSARDHSAWAVVKSIELALSSIKQGAENGNV